MQKCECHLPQFVSELASLDFKPERFECDEDASSLETLLGGPRFLSLGVAVAAPASDPRRHKKVPSGNRIHLDEIVWIHLHSWSKR